MGLRAWEPKRYSSITSPRLSGSGNLLVVQILRMIGLREKEPTLGDEPDILGDKRSIQQQCGSFGQAASQQHDRHRENQHQENPFHGPQELRSLAMEKLARVE